MQTASLRMAVPLVAALASCAHGTPADAAALTLQQLAGSLGIARAAPLPERLDLCTGLQARDGVPRLYCPERILTSRWSGQHVGALLEHVDETSWRFSVLLDIELR